MEHLRDILAGAERSGVGVGHFNVSELATLDGVVAAASELDLPVIVGVSESERAFIGIRRIAALVREIREESGAPVFLNADHTHSLDNALAAARAGFDSIVFDASSLPFDQNIAETRKAVEAVKAINPAIIVEGEIGNIGSGSEIHAEAPASAKILSTPEEAGQFVAATRVDVLAPAVGNMHGLVPGMVRGETRKRLDIPRIREIKESARVFLTLHGGSGTEDADFTQAIAAGVTVIHINTEIRLAWRKGLEQGLARNPGEVAPYKILPPAQDAVRQVVQSRLQLFSAGRRRAAS